MILYTCSEFQLYQVQSCKPVLQRLEKAVVRIEWLVEKVVALVLLQFIEHLFYFLDGYQNRISFFGEFWISCDFVCSGLSGARDHPLPQRLLDLLLKL